MSIKTPMCQFLMNQKGIIVFPDKAHIGLQTLMGKKMQQVLKGSEGYMAMGGQNSPIPESKLKELVKILNFFFGGLRMLKDFAVERMLAQFIKDKEINETKTKVVVL